MQDIDRYGIGQVMDKCVEYLGDKDIHLSFDVDAMDPFYAPSTGTAVRYVYWSQFFASFNQELGYYINLNFWSCAIATVC